VHLQKEGDHGHDEDEASSDGAGSSSLDVGRSRSDGIGNGDDGSGTSGVAVLEGLSQVVFVFMDFDNVASFSSGELDLVTLSVLSAVFSARNGRISLVAITSSLLRNIDGGNKVGTVGFVDLEGKGNSANNNLSDDNTSSLVQDVVGGEDVSVDLGVDVDGSARSNNVVDDSSRDGGEVVSVEVDSSSSEDVDDPFGSKGTFAAGLVPGDGVEDGGINVQDVFGLVSGAVNLEAEIGNVEVNVGGFGGQKVGDARVAVEGIGKVSLEVVAEDGVLSEFQVAGSVEVSTNKDAFDSSLVGSGGRDIGEDSARSKGTITSNNEGVRNKVVLAVGSVDFGTDRVSETEVQVSGNDQSTFNITSGGIEVTKGDGVEVSEGEEGISKSKRQVAQGFDFKEGASLRGRRRGSNNRGLGASRQVDLRSRSLGIVGSSDDQSFNDSVSLDEVVVRSNEMSVEVVDIHSSSSAEDVVDNDNVSEQEVTINGVEGVEGEGNSSSSSNVEDPLGSFVASNKSVVKDSAVEGTIKVDDVLVSGGRLASQHLGTIGDGGNGVGGQGSQFLADVVIVSLDVGKVADDDIVVKVGNDSSSNSNGELGDSSSDVGIFGLRRSRRSASSTGPVDIVCDDQREGRGLNNLVGSRSNGNSSNRVSGSSLEVSSNSKSAFSISSVDFGISKDNGIDLGNVRRGETSGEAEFGGGLVGAGRVGLAICGDVNSAQVNDWNAGGSRWLSNQLQGSCHSKVGSNSVSFGVEDLEGGIYTILEIEVVDVSGNVQIKGGRGGTVDSSKVNGKFAVDEDPDIIVTGEAPSIRWVGSNVGKLGGNFSSEVEVVSKVFKVAKTLTINREEGTAIKDEESRTTVI